MLADPLKLWNLDENPSRPDAADFDFDLVAIITAIDHSAARVDAHHTVWTQIHTMAKSRRNRAARRKDPISKPVKPPTDPELAALRTSKVLPVLADLQSADPKSRSAAATAISSIITDPRCRKLLLREQIVHIILTQTLTDAALESRAAGWRILQVLAQEEEADFCIHLYRQDVLTAMEFAAKMVCSHRTDMCTFPTILTYTYRKGFREVAGFRRKGSQGQHS